MKKSIVTTIVLLLSINLFAQHSIKGNVKGKENLQGVSISFSLSKKGTTTDAFGNYELKNIPTGKTTIHFSYTGYETLDTALTISSDITLDIVLQEKKENLDEVVVISSSRTNSRIEDLPTKVEVLGAEEVHEENQIKPGNIASLLGDIAGIQIQQTNAATGSSDLRIQGLQGKYTQILRDGMPLFGGFSGSFGILQIPPLDLQQIELIKGASSTVYGGGAIAGMVNLISKKPKLGSPEHSLTLNTSTLKENNANLFFSARNKKLGYTLFAGGTLQKEVDVNKDGFSDVPNVKSTFIHPRFFAYLTPKTTLILGYTFNYEDRIGGDMNVLNNQKDAAHQFFIQNKSIRNSIDGTVETKLPNNGFFTTKASINFFNRDVATNVSALNANQTLWYTEVAYTQKLKKHTYVLGLNFNGDDFKKKSLDINSLLPNEFSNTVGLFAQDDWKFNNHFTLQAGLRTDFNSSYGTFILPRLSLMYKVNNAVTMRLGGGLGYKTPTLFTNEVDERDYKYLNGYRNDITAEKSYGANYDINYKTKAGEWDLTLNQTFFYNQIDKPISLYYQYGIIGLSSPVIAQYYNETKPVQTAGFETYIAARQDELELYLGYVYTNAKRKYTTTNQNLPLIARNKLATVIAYEFSEHFRAGIEAAYTGKQYLDNGTQTQDYVFAALMVRYGFKRVSFVLNCENLFDYRQNKNNQTVFPSYTNPSFPEIWAPLDGRVINLSMMIKW